ncbi:uncharacterized protein I303_107525 [Kwoniella dejecticola CBS 10117]|uniref:Uncharacterized protein n=1 Tax=Kwoniella dejecticola CBS 10117 TaxID=1296121 RepID=A0A1A5ZZW7_9TREE|nr:uncharacterized protein I303_06930 [Kwoniella dejecticola CBS 10117]OBR83365.1 hypothetical protein I303_06930 [Kwoniella dejecticola CBS 10117]
MIIPPDPEKDPRLFDPSASTPSLVQPPSEYEDTTSRWDGDGDSESLPPYERRRGSQSSCASSSHEGFEADDIFADRHASTSHSRSRSRNQNQNQSRTRTPNPPGLIIHNINLPSHPEPIHPSSSSPISSSDSLTPTASRPSMVLPHFTDQASSTLQASGSTSTSKLWESSTATATSVKRNKTVRICGCIRINNSGVQRWWKRWRRWAQVVVVLIFIGIGLVVGLLVGMTRNENKGSPTPPWQKPWMDQDTDGKRVAAWAGYGSFNLTYVDSRDGPSSFEGNLTECNNFAPLNLTSSPFLNLFTPFPDSSVSLASFSFPLSSSGVPPSDLFINARGFGSSGHLDFIGSDGPEAIVTSGEEGKILMDVITKYAGDQDLTTMMRVCKMTRGDSGVGIGIYSPKETDGKMTNPFKLDPNLIPTNLIVVRLPPSWYTPQSPYQTLPSFSLDAEQMVVRLGNLNNVASFTALNLDTCRGGVQVNYARAKKASIVAFEGSVRGTWNISESLIVNVTEGSITSDIILSDPNLQNDNTTTLPPISDYTTVVRRSPDDDSTDDSDTDFENEVHSLFNATSYNPTESNDTRATIVTNLFTTSGYVNLRYLHQPSTIDLSAIIGTQQGNMDISLNPTYVGPLISRTHWGQINLKRPSPVPNYDPSGKARVRQLLVGPIEIKDNSTFAVLGYTQEKLQSSPDTLSGYVYWADKKYNGKIMTQTMEQLQAQQGGQTQQTQSDNQVIALGNWGDVDISFDGE